MLFNFFEKEMPTRVKFKLSSNKCYLNILFFLSLCHYFGKFLNEFFRLFFFNNFIEFSSITEFD
jgi:hypothetical protein